MKIVIEMARQSGYGDHMSVLHAPALERFAALIRADERNSWPAEMEAMERQVNILTDALAEERERMKWDVHSCCPTCKRYACVAMREAVEAEREALYSLETDAHFIFNNPPGEASQEVRDVIEWYAAAIRARSKT